MKQVASSPERHTFQKDGYIERCKEEGKEPNPNYVRMYETWKAQDEANIVDPSWQKDNMEYDLRSSKELCDKVKASDVYAQNLYAAMCNMQWQSREFWQELKGETWSCSWRSSGGIIADMREQGDYIDWYCSGIRNGDDTDNGFMPEGHVTEEIELDLNRLGWRPVPWSDDK